MCDIIYLFISTQKTRSVITKKSVAIFDSFLQEMSLIFLLSKN